MKAIYNAIFLLFLLPIISLAQSPKTLSYQGVLTDAEGEVLPDNTYTLTFGLYDALSSGNLLWEEDISAKVKNGLFNVILGGSEALDLPFDNPYWLSISVDGGDELEPRTALTASPYSLGGKATELDLSGVADFHDGVMIEGGDTALYIVPVEGGMYFGPDSTANGLRGDINTRKGLIEDINAGEATLTLKQINVSNLKDIAIYATSGKAPAILANSDNSNGVWGISQTGSAIFGQAFGNKPAVHGSNDSNFGVLGESDISFGVVGRSKNFIGIRGEGASLGVEGIGKGNTGVGIKGSGPFAAGLFEGNVLIKGDGKLYIDNVDLDNSEDRFLVWGSQGLVEYRILDDIISEIQDDAATDEIQTLSLAGNTLSISKGNSVVLPTAGEGSSFNGCLNNLDFKITTNEEPFFTITQGKIADLKGKFTATNSSEKAIVGISASNIGVQGQTETNIGVFGASTANGIGVQGQSVEGIGIKATSVMGTGVDGKSDKSVGVSGISKEDNGIYGFTESAFSAAILGESDNTPGVRGDSGMAPGVSGTSDENNGVEGKTLNAGFSGVHGESESGIGVSAYSMTNNGVEGESKEGNGIYGFTESAFSAAIFGESDNTPGVRGDSGMAPGVSGTSDENNGVEGRTFSEGFSGVHGESELGIGVSAYSKMNYGVESISDGNIGVYSKSEKNDGIYGITIDENSSGVQGYSEKGFGTTGTSIDKTGIYGRSEKENGVYGTTQSEVWSGVEGYAEKGFGVIGRSKNRNGVYASSEKDNAIYGTTMSAEKAGVVGENAEGIGVRGTSTNNYGVFGFSQTSVAIFGQAPIAGQFNGNVHIETNGQLKIDKVDADNSDKLLVWADDKFVKYRSLNDILPDDADMDPGNEIQMLTKDGPIITLDRMGGFVQLLDDDDKNEIQTLSKDGSVITLDKMGQSVTLMDDDPTNELFSGTLCDKDLVVKFGEDSVFVIDSESRVGVEGAFGAHATAALPAITGAAEDNVSGFYYNNSSFLPTGIFQNLSLGGPALSVIGNSFYGNGSNTYITFTPGQDTAAQFFGAVDVQGTFTALAKSFVIDHPLDPENKKLKHFSIESDQLTNIYNGNAIMDDAGESWVELPDWFEALNKDITYQLTCVGGFANVYIAEEVNENKFKIGGGKEGLKVSWQVSGVRHDRQSLEIDQTVEILK